LDRTDREKVTGVWTDLHNVQLHNLYRSTGIFCFRGLFNDPLSNAVQHRLMEWLKNIEMAGGWKRVGRECTDMCMVGVRRTRE
jgi:hypothetical protein